MLKRLRRDPTTLTQSLTIAVKKPKVSQQNQLKLYKMTNKHLSKQHGFIGKVRLKSKPRKRLNKEKARVRKAERLEAKKAA
ncbi:MAG: hypothetical protein WCX95_01115 [Candidatus Gracilibacteria bacterium]